LLQTFIRKLKFQYIEQNAKDKYVKYIVNDLDDAPFIGEHDIKELDEINKQLKLELNNAKAKAAQLETVTKELAPKFAKSASFHCSGQRLTNWAQQDTMMSGGNWAVGGI
jgi:hypothetical protein